MIRVRVREVTIPVVTVLSVLCGGCFPPVLDPNTREAVHVPDTRRDVTVFRLCFADVTEWPIREIGFIWVLTVIIWFCFISQWGLVPVYTRLARFRSAPNSSMVLGPLVQAAEHVIQEWGEGPEDTDLLQVSYVRCTVLFCQFDKVTPVVGLIEEFKFSLDDLHRKDCGGDIQVVVIISVTTPTHVFSATRLNDRTNTALKRVSANGPGESCVWTLQTLN